MDFAGSTWWWMLAGALVIAELLTGTFYLLMVALGAAAGAVAAQAGLAATAQLVSAALVGGGATALWHLKRARSPRSAPAESNRDVNLDIGQTVHVTQWNPDGTARVAYRGASWAAHYAGNGAPAPGDHLIVSIQGSSLGLAPAMR